MAIPRTGPRRVAVSVTGCCRRRTASRRACSGSMPDTVGVRRQWRAGGHRSRPSTGGRGRPTAPAVSGLVGVRTAPAGSAEPVDAESRLLLLGLDLLPTSLMASASPLRPGLHRAAEDVRVAAVHLLDDVAGHVVDREVAGTPRRWRGVEVDLEQQVTELLAQVLLDRGVDRLELFVGLLEQVSRERAMGLPGLPGCTRPAAGAGPGRRNSRSGGSALLASSEPGISRRWRTAAALAT